MELPGLSQLPVAVQATDPQALASQARSADPRSIHAVATGFESVFVSLLLKEMRQSLESGSFFGEDKSDIHGGLFDMYMSQHLTQAGGLGLGKMIQHQLEAYRNR